MWVLVAAIFVAILVALYILSSFQTHTTQQGIVQSGDEARVTAAMGVGLLALCAQQAPASNPYTQRQIGGNRFPADTPTGAAWMCQVTAGGSHQGKTVVLYLDGPPKQWALAGINGSTGTASPTIQMNFATTVAADMAQALAGQNDVQAGVIQAGDPEPFLHITYPTPTQVSLSGDMPANPPPPLTYTTPALALGVAKKEF
jgi:hypothetical protein